MKKIWRNENCCFINPPQSSIPYCSQRFSSRISLFTERTGIKSPHPFFTKGAMKIIHLADEIWDSGLTDYALTLASAQKTIGCKIYFACLECSFAHKKAKALGLNTITIAKKPTAFVGFAKKAKKINPQIINAHTGSTHTLAVLAKKIFRLKGMTVRTRADARPMIKKPLWSFLWKNTDGFIAANSKILARFKQKIKFEIPIALVPQAIGNAPTPRSILQNHTIGILARLDPVKGHKTAIEALAFLKKNIPDIMLKISGSEQNITRKELMRYAKKLNIDKHISFEGFVKDKYEFINSCSVGLIPSVASEAVSRAAIEWISQGKPVVASDVGGISDIINNNIGTLVEPSNPKALAEATEKILSNKEKLTQMSVLAVKHFTDNFTPQIFARNTLKFYNEVIRT